MIEFTQFYGHSHSVYGNKVPKTLADRIHKCPICGVDRA
jgi:hypothetical protein